jgi:small subunit ribosomal protein S20
LANIKSAQKRIKTNEKRRQKNASVKSSIRTASKRVLKATSGQSADANAAGDIYKAFVKTMDTSARKRVVHWKTAARKKSRLAKKVNALTQKKSAEA